MRIPIHVIMYFNNFINSGKIYPTNHFNTQIYNYNYSFDRYRYRSKGRRIYKKIHGYTGYVQDHHIIPKECKNHDVIQYINYDINSANNLLIMPTFEGIQKLKLSPNVRTHYNGHNKYNLYIKHVLDNIDIYKTRDEKMYNFWLFYCHLKYSLKVNDTYLPWK